MRTRLLSLKTLLVICLMAIVGGVETWADTYKYTFTSAVFKKTSTTSKENLETQKLGDVSWTTSGVIPYLGYNATKGMQFGSTNKKNPLTNFKLTTSGIQGVITKVVVSASTGSGGNTSYTVSVGGTSFGTQKLSKATDVKDYTFSGSNSGDVVIAIESFVKVATYIKSIEITYTPSSSSSVAAPTFSADSKSFSDKFDLTLSAGSDAAMIMYTTDGTTPSYKNNVGKLYEAPISITHSTTVKAIAISSKEEESAVVTNEYKLELPAPTISEATKIFTVPFTVSLSTEATAAEAILYTLDGTVPSRENKATEIYTKPIQISATTTLKAVSYATNGTTYEYSPIATTTYTEQGDAPVVIWSEDWSTFSDDEKPTKGTNATYVCGGAKTSVKKGDVENYAGGVTPEIMIADKGSLSITINDLKGADNGLMFTFKTNRDESEFQVSADNATILSNEVIGDSKDTRKYIMVLNEGTTTLTIKLDNQTGKNARVDDLELSIYSGVGSFKITEAGYGTYYTSDAYTMPEGVKGYTITGNEGTSLVMKEAYAAGDVVPAKTALVVEGAANKYYTLVAASTELTPDNDNKLHGSDEAETTYVDGTDVKYYKLSYNNEGNNLGFYWGSENGAAFTNGAHKAYLALDSEKLLSQSRGFSLADLANGVTTGINTTVKSATQSNFIYDLNGRRINSLNGAAKGVYIMNGQKVLVK